MRLYQIISRLLQATVLITFILAAVLPCVAAWTTQAAASTADFAAIEAFVEQRIHDLPIPGLAVVQGDQIIYRRGFGVTGPDGRGSHRTRPFRSLR